MKNLSLVAKQHAKKGLKNKSSQSLFTKYDVVFDASFLKVLVVLITMLLSGISDVAAQRVRYSYEWPCYESPVPSDPTPPVLESPLCQAVVVKEYFTKGKPIAIGKTTPIPNASTLIKIYGPTVSNKIFDVKEDFAVDATIQFNNCTVVVNAGKTIYVEGGNSFYSDASKFFCCKGMWEGIHVNDKGRIYLSNKTLIEDANKAVYATNKAALLRIRNTTFNRNLIGCYFESSASGTGILPLGSFEGNTFSCSSKLNTPTDGYYWAIAGVFVDNVNIPTLGSTSNNISNFNLFTGNIRCGLDITDNAVVKIAGSRFVDITFDVATIPSQLFDDAGFAVAADKSNVSVTGLGNNPKSIPYNYTFENNSRGVMTATASSINIAQCGIKSVTQDAKSTDITKSLAWTENLIFSENNKKLERIIVENNYFQIWDVSELVTIDKSNGQYNTVSSNIIDLKPGVSNAFVNSNSIKSTSLIHLYNANTKCDVAAINNAFIAGNTITAFDGSYSPNGIFLEGNISDLNGIKVNNLVINNRISNLCGGINIALIRTTKTRVSGNILNGHIEPTKIGTAFATGIDVVGTTEMPAEYNTICNNKIDYLKEAIHFGGTCSENQVSNNSFGRSELNGLHLNPFAAKSYYNPVIGNQFELNQDGDLIAYQNEWNWNNALSPSLKTKFDALFEVSPKANKQTNVFLSQFKVDNKNNKYPTAPVLISVPAGTKPEEWFNPINNFILTFPPSCEAPTLVSTETSVARWTNLDEAILKGEFDEEYPAMDWEAKRYLYQRMLAYPTILENKSERLAFKNAIQSSSAAAYTQAKNSIAHTFEVASQDAEILDNLIAQQNLVAHSIEEYIAGADALFGDSEWFEADLNVIAVKSNELADINAKIENTKATIDAKRQAALEVARIETENLVAQTIYEKAYKAAYVAWVRAALNNGVIAEETLETIRATAHLCIGEAGSSVLIARDLLPRCERNLIPLDYNCTGQPIIGKVVKNNNNTLAYPNPVDNLLLLNTYNLQDAHYVSVIDINSRMVFSAQLASINNQIDVSTFQNGIYFLQIRNAKGSVINTEKIIVQH